MLVKSAIITMGFITDD